MKILVIDHGSFMLDFVLRAQRDGHVVKWYTIRREWQYVGKGLATFVTDWEDHVRWADLIVLGDNTKYLKRLDLWRGRCAPIFGASEAAAAWEIDRTLGMKIFKKQGIPIPPYREFTAYDTAISYVKHEGRRFVSKPLGDEPDKSLSYVSKGPADMVYMLQRWNRAKRHKAGFILQECIDGCEMAVGAYFGPHGFSSGWCENWEFKKLMAGDHGPATGEMGTILRFVRRSKLAELVLAPLEEALQALGYVGYVDVNCIIDDHGDPWPLEFTMRFGWPTFNIQSALIEGDIAEWMIDLTQGRDAKPFSLDSVACGVVLAIPDFPYSKLTRKDVRGIPVHEAAGNPNLHPCELMLGSAPKDVEGKVIDQPCLVTAGDYLLVASGLGDTVSQAQRAAYKTLKTVQVPNSPFYRPDIGDRLKKQLPQIQAKGYARGMTY